jgi:hypothetical protein
MVLSEEVIQSITPEIRLKLALALGFREHYITTLIKKNQVNGKLTTFKAMQVLRRELKLSDREILTDEKITV